MDAKKKHRKVLRTAFSKKVNELEKSLSEEDINIPDVKVTWTILQENYYSLKVIDDEIYETLLGEKASEDDLLKELENSEEYKRKYLYLEQLYGEKVPDPVAPVSVIEQASAHSSCTGNSIERQGKRKFKLPTIQLKVFDGNIKEWLPFWAQFKKVHEDVDICPEDKIHYLVQATLPGSRARQLIESFPAVGENYTKIIDCLTSRFGREDLQIEIYIRELLKLILSNTLSVNKLETAILYDKLETHLRALESLGVRSEESSAMLFPLIESCLSEDLIRVWQRSPRFSEVKVSETSSETGSTEYQPPKMEDKLKSLMSFLQSEVENDQRVKLASEGFGLASVSSQGGTRRGGTVHKYKKDFLEPAGVPTASGLVNFNANHVKCVFCDNPHDSAECFKAQNFDLSEKKKILTGKRACFNCLKVGHQARKCRARLKCVVCGKGHTPLMCPSLQVNSQVKEPTEPRSDNKTISNELVSVNEVSGHIFMQTLKVRVDTSKGYCIVRVLIDTGSQRSYILRNTTNCLGLVSKRREQIVHCLFGGSLSQQWHDCFDIRLSNGSFSLDIEVLDQAVICTSVPPVFYGDWVEELNQIGIQLSDMCSGPRDNGKIDILIGSDVAGALYTGRRHILSSGLVAVETLLGWTLMGKVTLTRLNSSSLVDIALFARDFTLPQLWEMDVLGIKDPIEKKSEDELALATKEVFLETLTVNSEGRYEVRMPWLEGHPPLPSYYSIAKHRLLSIQNKLKRDELLEEYEQVFQDWLNDNIIEEVHEEVIATENVLYLPHRPVLKEGSTTRIRPVFDASTKVKDEPSLNQCLNKGPNLLELMPNILIRFRMRQIGVIADIKKAFLQISVNKSDRDFLRFLWIDRQGHERVFRHRRVVFGVSCSPFLLGATLEFHLSEALKKCELGDSEDMTYTREILLQLSKSFYVDNCVASVRSHVELQKFIKEATIVMSQAGFDLRGWEFSGQESGGSENSPLTAVLGMSWDKFNDTLSINETCLRNGQEVVNGSITKRIMLSFAQKIFDPIGFTSPVTLLPKLLLQKTWAKKLAWDSPVQAEIEEEFQQWVNELHFLLQIKVPRWIHMDISSFDGMSLHVFCDASKTAYAAVVFFRGVFDGKVVVHLLAAKSRIAPLKQITIPRLELLAALLGSRLFVSLRNEVMCDSQMGVYFWSDSTTVLSWINRTENWGTFVSNRVKEIRSQTNSADWRYVPGVLNPADLPSRGCSPKHLYESRWWEGPSWLYADPHLWPNITYDCDESEINEEKKKSIVTLLAPEIDIVDWHLTYFSKFTKTVRMVGWIFRFLYNMRTPDTRHQGELSVAELEDAEMHVFRMIQVECFGSLKDPRLSDLSPFKDDRGVIRLRTRISNREDIDSFRFPIVLPAKHFLVERLIFEQHIRSLHVGTQGLINILREKFWVLGGRRSVKRVISNCVVCKRHRSTAFKTSLAPLPLNRVRDAVSFEIVGVDFAGPMYLKGGEKAWVCLFTCAVYRAVHLELCTHLTTASFMQALRRFIARRGRPRIIYSDNGTNFVGTAHAFDKLNWTKITTDCNVQKITWYLNPPTASWWGGFWERLVGVLKQILRKVLGRACVSYEDLVTILCDCETIINLRPITYVSNDNNDLTPLTPMMFLREQVCDGVPDCDMIDAGSLSDKLRHKQKLRDDFRQRFRTEYLGQLKAWSCKKPSRPIVVGEMVFVGNDVDKRLFWPLGRVTEVIPSRDGQIRLVRVNTARGSLLRPVQRLFPLEEDPKCTATNDAPPTGAITEEIRTVEHATPTQNAIQCAGVQSRVPASVKRVTRGGREVRMPVRFL